MPLTDGDGDSPRWIVENTSSGPLTRNVHSASGDLAATTAKSGETLLQFTSVHGDVALQLPLDTTKAPVALDSEEYGKSRTGQQATGKLRVRWWKPWWSPKYFPRLDLTRSETAWVAMGTGAALGFTSWAKDIMCFPSRRPSGRANAEPTD